MNMSKMGIEITFTTPILGSSPADPEIHSRYIASRAPSPWQSKEEETASKDAADDAAAELATKGITVFPSDDKGIFLWDYQIKGFFKHAGNILKDHLRIKNLRSKLDDHLFIRPRKVYILRNSSILTEEDEVLERPLRAMTQQGPRVTLAASEMINPPVSIAFAVELLEYKSKKEEGELTLDTLTELLDYGAYHGLGQWRNGGYGQFTWRRLDRG